MALHVAILGYGRLGRALAKRALSAGHRVSVLFDDGASNEARSNAREAGHDIRQLRGSQPDIDFLAIALNRARMRGDIAECLSLARNHLASNSTVATATRLDKHVASFEPAALLRISCSPAIAAFPEECACYFTANSPSAAVARLQHALAPARWTAVAEPEFDVRERSFAVAGVICAVVARFSEREPEMAHPEWMADAVTEARLLLAASRYNATRAYEAAATPGGIVESLSGQLLAPGVV